MWCKDDWRILTDTWQRRKYSERRGVRSEIVYGDVSVGFEGGVSDSTDGDDKDDDVVTRQVSTVMPPSDLIWSWVMATATRTFDTTTNNNNINNKTNGATIKDTDDTTAVTTIAINIFMTTSLWQNKVWSKQSLSHLDIGAPFWGRGGRERGWYELFTLYFVIKPQSHNLRKPFNCLSPSPFPPTRPTHWS